jgi:hypothetical protein
MEVAQRQLTGKEQTVLAMLSQLGAPTSVQNLAQRCWARKRRLPQKEKIVRKALAKFKKMGLAKIGPNRRMDRGQWKEDYTGWVATDEGQRMGQDITYQRRIANP